MFYVLCKSFDELWDQSNLIIGPKTHCYTYNRGGHVLWLDLAISTNTNNAINALVGTNNTLLFINDLGFGPF